MKEKALYIFLIVAIVTSVALTYERSFVWKNFELTNSNEDTGSVAPEGAGAPQENFLVASSSTAVPEKGTISPE